MNTQHQQTQRRRTITWPTAHILALAPIDVWVRMLIRSGGVKPRYWVRLGFILVTSLVGTIATVHERVVLSVVRRRRFGAEPRIERPTIVILGYYRSGTTHLHNLMSCDDRLITPRWYQCLAGQGFVLGWSILRFALVPFLGSTRPQDSVGFGPNWPAEDDFAMSTWGMCSSIPGRFIWPSQWDDWKRWHGLEGLSEKELHRWRSLMAMFIWKLTRGKNREKTVLLKTPSHTARVGELDRLCGRPLFVHIVRDPKAVIDSNVRLHLSLTNHLLEDAPDVQTIRDRIVEEYAQTEKKVVAELNALDDERMMTKRFVRVRYQDLRADEIGTIERIYNTLGMRGVWWNAEVEGAIRKYLGALGTYANKNEQVDLGEPSAQEIEVCEQMREWYYHDTPPAEVVEIEHQPLPHPKTWRGIGAAMLVGLGCTLGWIGLVWMIHTAWDDARMRLIPLIWIIGALIGLGAERASGIGSRRLGIGAAAITLLVVFAVGFPISVINYNFASAPYNTTDEWFYHNAKYAYEGIRSVASLVYIVLGAMTAYRLASVSGPAAPGKAIPKSAQSKSAKVNS